MVRLRGFMAEHNWITSTWVGQKPISCSECGLFHTSRLQELPCPPWSSTDEGEITNTNRIREAGVVKKLNEILENVTQARDSYKEQSFILGELCLLNARILLENLIQKHEGHDRK